MGLQVMHRFLRVFGTFKWVDNALSVQGPIPVSVAREQKQGDDFPCFLCGIADSQVIWQYALPYHKAC